MNRLDWRELFKEKEGAPLPEKDAAAMDAYFRRFTMWPQNDRGESLCPGCGLSLGKGGDLGLVNFLMAGAPGRTTYQWGIAHGECACVTCGYPARAVHYDVGGKGDEALVTNLRFNLPYHPDELPPDALTRCRSVALAEPEEAR